jgi:hypothetical protein
MEDENTPFNGLFDVLNQSNDNIKKTTISTIAATLLDITYTYKKPIKTVVKDYFEMLNLLSKRKKDG